MSVAQPETSSQRSPDPINGGIGETAILVRRAPRWMWLLLVVSLAANLLIIGIVSGSLWAIRHGGFWDAPLMLERTHRFMSHLPGERRERIQTIFSEHKEGLKPLWRDLRESRRTIGQLIEKGSYSQEEFNAALDDLFLKEMQARQAAKPMITAMISELEPNEREHFLSIFMPYLNEVQVQPQAQRLD